MKEKREKLGDKAKVSATILGAHLSWAQKQWPDALERLRPHLDAESLAIVTRPLATSIDMTHFAETDRILLRDLVRIARAIAAAAGGDPDETFHALGRHSAALNLAGAYHTFTPEEPHRFFGQMAYLHRSFQNFGRSSYERVGERAGRIRIEGYEEYSPVFCESGRGYYEEALTMMRASGPISVVETSCQSAGDACCLYEMLW